MKLIFRQYLASLREREELDAILPDLLSELGFHVYSRPQRGTAQAGVDIAAVGNDEDGERKIFLFSVKQGDLTRQSWDGNPQALRTSLNQIIDTYIPTRIPKKYQGLRKVVCLVFGGDVQEQVRQDVTGYINKNSTDEVSFDEWNGDKLAALLMRGILREEIMPKSSRSHFQKAVAMVDEPDVAIQHFRILVSELLRDVKDDKSSIRVSRQVYIALWVMFVWSRDADNVEAAYQASELIILTVWDLLRTKIDKGSRSINRQMTTVLGDAIRLHLRIAFEFLDRKIGPIADIQDGLATAIRTRTHVDINLKLFDAVGRISMTGLWACWMNSRDTDKGRKAATQAIINNLANRAFQVIDNNPALYLPIQDEQAIEVSLLLLFVEMEGNQTGNAVTWLHSMVQRLWYAVKYHGNYPTSFSEYRELIPHPREATEEYRKEATSGSTLIPLLGAYLTAIGDEEAVQLLSRLKSKELEHCTLQLWMPDVDSENQIYTGSGQHGIAICELPLPSTGDELLETIHQACESSKDFNQLSAIATGYWPIILTACHHYRLPVPPQFWIQSLRASPDTQVSETLDEAEVV